MIRNAILLSACAAILQAQVVTPPSTAVFDTDTVHEIRLTFAQPDWYQQLTTDYDAHPDDTPYRQASLTWGQYQFDTVGVRFKGNSSYRGATTMKKPFRIKLNEFTKGQKIDGMSSFGLSNAWSDPSFVREKPYYEVAAAAGLAAPRSNFAALYINGTYWGLYILGEIVNSDFLKLHFAKGDDGGNLYKAADLGANLAYLGTDPAVYAQYFSKESNEDANDWTDLIELARIFDQTAIADLPSKLDSLVDIDSFLTAFALDNLTVNLDSYVGMAQNYYLYRRPSDQKWVWIPWDPSLAWGALAQGLTVQQMKNLALEYVQTSGPGGGGGGTASARPIASKLWQVPAYNQRYLDIYKKLVNLYLIPSEVLSRMNTMRDLIRPYVTADTQKLVTQAQFDAAMTSDATSGGVNSQAAGAPGLQPFLEGRDTAVKALLSGQTPLTVNAAPSSAYFAAVAGASPATVQNISLSISPATSGITYTASASSAWINVTQPSGSFPATLRITVNAASLVSDTYTGAVNVAVGGVTNSPLSIPVTLSVAPSPALVSSPASLTFNATDSPSKTFTIASTAGASSFTAAISDTTCSNFLTVTPTTGTTPATLTVRATQVGQSNGCEGKINLTSNGLAAAVVPVTLSAPAGPGGNRAPSISSLVNGASYASGPVAPGELVTIFGSNMGPADPVSGTFADGKLATIVSGVQVTFDGTAASLVYVRFNQVSAMVPFEAAGKTQVQVQLVYNGQSSPPMTVPVSLTAPGLFTTASDGAGQVSIINQAGEVNAANAAAPKGSTIAIYLTGAGQMTPSGVSGAAGLSGQNIVAPATVMVGGVNSTVVYQGAVPGTLQGIYQINAVVPQGSPSGSVPIAVTVGGTAAQSAVTMYVE